MKKNCNIVERASVDEAYLDITQIVDDKLSKEEIDWEEMLGQLNTTFIVGHSEINSNNEGMLIFYFFFLYWCVFHFLNFFSKEIRKKGLETWLSESSEDPQIQRLAIAGVIVENIRQEVFETTGFRCSAGISFNKVIGLLNNCFLLNYSIVFNNVFF